MDAMTILKRYKQSAGEIERLQTRIEQRRAAASGMSARIDAIPGGGGVSDRVGRISAEIADLETEKDAREMAQSAELASACTLMDYVPQKESQVLYAYWIEGKSTGVIATELHYTQAYVRRIKRAGEQLLDMLTPERVAETLPRWYMEKYGG